MQDIFERLESEVRSYCRAFPRVFRRAQGSYLEDVDGQRYLDFFAGAGALNYGHNPAALKSALVDYIQDDCITHGLDMYTEAKGRFLEAFERRILSPRQLRYRVQFTGPTGTNAVECAFKVARKATGRSGIVFFTNGFHGLTLGSLAATGNRKYRRAAGTSLPHTAQVPFDAYHGPGVDTAAMLRRYLEDASSGVDLPAAVVLETVQAEGGVHVAGTQWLRDIAGICREHGILLICDDIQVGCGRTGPFFSFERAGIAPDIVCLSKSLSAYGLPMAVTLIKPEHDVWEPGEHTGTFRGHNLAFVTAREALEHFWSDDALTRDVERKGRRLHEGLSAIAEPWADRGVEVRGLGLIQGLDLRGEDLAGAVSEEAFSRGMVIETAGASDNVVKCLVPLVIDDADLDKGLGIIEDSVKSVMQGR